MSLDTRVIRATPVGADVTRWTKVIPFILIVMAQASVGHSPGERAGKNRVRVEV